MCPGGRAARKASDVVKAVIIYYASASPSHVVRFIRSLSLLKRHVLNRHDYPVLAFVEAGFSQGLQSFVRALSGVPVRFERVNPTVPEGVDSGRIPADGKVGLCKFPMGYRHMCRFFAGQVFEHPALQESDWYLRLDTDSYIMSEMREDPFARMSGGAFLYGHVCPAGRKTEPAFAVEGLWEASLDFFGSFPPSPYLSGGRWNRCMLYTNFEVVYLPWWRSNAYMDYYRTIDRLGGIYYHRWGDAPIRTLALAARVPASRVLMFEDFRYRHQQFDTRA